MSTQLLAKISFPVYVLGKTKPLYESGVWLYLLGKDLKYSDATYKALIVDDTNLEEKTLAGRRLRLLANQVKLFKLKKAIFFIGDLIKLAKKGIWFIDNTGFVFEYQKSRRVPLIFKKITKLTALPAGGALVEVQGISTRFKTLFAPTIEFTHAGLLVWDKAYILYGLYDKEYKSTVRSI